ncbi:hypothetical protein BH23CHL8_BH23CHL8_31510 [soil metagenome]
MAGRGPAPTRGRRRANAPTRGDWKAAPGLGWQHGKAPEPPKGLLPESQETWKTWMSGIAAAHWEPGDVPGLRIVIGLHDRVSRGDSRATALSELRLWCDSYGIGPKGRQSLRWLPPEPTVKPKSKRTAPYEHLRLIDIDPSDVGA